VGIAHPERVVLPDWIERKITCVVLAQFQGSRRQKRAGFPHFKNQTLTARLLGCHIEPIDAARYSRSFCAIGDLMPDTKGTKLRFTTLREEDEFYDFGSQGCRFEPAGAALDYQRLKLKPVAILDSD
jgi:hypothetical protein